MASSEFDLITCATRGDQEAFRQLWEAHHAVAMATAWRLCHHRALAEEITQGAFLLAWRGLPRFQIGNPFRPWFMRILYRHALDVMEKYRLYDHPISLTEVIIGAGTAFFYALHNRSLVPVLIVIVGGASLFFLLDRQRRHLCYAADTLVVLWLGRNRMCEGLHVLANATRSPHRGRWGEPALAARITRVCGTRVESRNERLTMAR